MNGWQIFERACEWGWILALVLFFAVVIYIVVTALRFKSAVMGHAKRLYERPAHSVKTLAATGKGIAQQETVRVRHIAGTVKQTAVGVKGAATEVKGAAQTVHPGELKSAVANVRSAMANVRRTFQLVTTVLQFTRGLRKQKAARS